MFEPFRYWESYTVGSLMMASDGSEEKEGIKDVNLPNSLAD